MGKPLDAQRAVGLLRPQKLQGEIPIRRQTASCPDYNPASVGHGFRIRRDENFALHRYPHPDPLEKQFAARTRITMMTRLRRMIRIIMMRTTIARMMLMSRSVLRITECRTTSVDYLTGRMTMKMRRMMIKRTLKRS